MNISFWRAKSTPAAPVETPPNEPQLIWATKKAGDAPAWHERPFPGAISDAIAFLKTIADEADFMLGQVLEHDGRVVATIAHTDK